MDIQLYGDLTRFELPKTVHELVRQHPLTAGHFILGSGSYAVVLDGGDTVLKATRCEQSYKFLTEYLVDMDESVRRFFPEVITDYGLIGELPEGPVYLMEMEKLYPLQPGSQLAYELERIRRTYNQVSRHLMEASASNPEFLEMDSAVALGKMAPMEWEADMAAAIECLSDFVFMENGQAVLDFLPPNGMMRADGSFVFSDPIYTSPD